VDRLSEHQVQLAVFVAVFVIVTVLGFAAARWRRPDLPPDLEQWGLGGRAFGNFVTWFLLGGDLYTAYTFVAVPALVASVGAAGFFAIPFAVITFPLAYMLLTRLWSVSHVHGFVTPAEFVMARFGSRALMAIIGVAGIVATMPYVALQLVGLEAVLKVMGVSGWWPLTAAFGVLALYTFKSGLRAPALISIVRDVLALWTVLAVLVLVAMFARGWDGIVDDAAAHFANTPSLADGVLLTPSGHLNYVTFAVGSALGIFLYPHAQTGVLAARSRMTIKRNMVALPLYTLMLGVIALLGLAAVSAGTKPVDGDRNTIVPAFLDAMFPDWCAGLAFAAIGIGALIPAAIMSIAAANLFTRAIYRQYLRPFATDAEETRVSKIASLLVKVGAVLAVVLLNPHFSTDFQLIGGVVILQTLPAVAIGLFTAWPHRWALLAGLLGGLAFGVALLYQIPQLGPNGGVLREHFGGASWPLARFGLDTGQSVYVGVLALAVNLIIVGVGTLVLRAAEVPSGPDRTSPGDYFADEGDPTLARMAELVDGSSGSRVARHLR
jgi:solute:Na+ symporter, SSS family